MTYFFSSALFIFIAAVLRVSEIESDAPRGVVINTTPPAHLLYRLYLFWCPFPKMKTLSIIAPPRAVRRVSVLH
jgi:hypothetical protein